MTKTLDEIDELTLEGAGEGSESEDDLGRVDPSLVNKAVVTGTDWTADSILKQLEKGNIVLEPTLLEMAIFQHQEEPVDNQQKGIKMAPLGEGEKYDQALGYYPLVCLLLLCSQPVSALCSAPAMEGTWVNSDPNPAIKVMTLRFKCCDQMSCPAGQPCVLVC